jgi:cysteine desulfuration protein SufE
MPVPTKQRSIISRYRIIEDAHERLAAITARGKKWPGLTEAERTETALVPGCSSRVWLVGELRDGKCHFRMEADSPLVKGLAALMCEMYEGGSPEQVAEVEPELASELGLDRMLSPTRLNGLASIRATIREFARQHV